MSTVVTNLLNIKEPEPPFLGCVDGCSVVDDCPVDG